MPPHHDRAVSGAHWPGCGDALHPAGAAGAAVRAAHGPGERAASEDEVGAAGVAQRLAVLAVHEGKRIFGHVCGRHHLLRVAGNELLLLFRCFLEEWVHLKMDIEAICSYLEFHM